MIRCGRGVTFWSRFLEFFPTVRCQLSCRPVWHQYAIVFVRVKNRCRHGFLIVSETVLAANTFMTDEMWSMADKSVPHHSEWTEPINKNVYIYLLQKNWQASITSYSPFVITHKDGVYFHDVSGSRSLNCDSDTIRTSVTLNTDLEASYTNHSPHENPGVIECICDTKI